MLDGGTGNPDVLADLDMEGDGDRAVDRNSMSVPERHVLAGQLDRAPMTLAPDTKWRFSVEFAVVRQVGLGTGPGPRRDG